MNAADDVRAREIQQVVVSHEVARPVGKPRAAVVRFIEPAVLHHRAHRTVEDDDTLPEQGFEFGKVRQGPRRTHDGTAAEAWPAAGRSPSAEQIA